MHHPAASAATPDVTPTGGGSGRRIHGVDLARGLAIVGMVMVHVAPPLAGDGGWYSLSFGRSSALFAMIAGVGIALSSRRGSTREHRARLVWRASWLAPVGLLLTVLGTPVAVILQYYALWFLLAAPVLRLGTRLLTTLTVAGLLLGPTVLVWAQVTHPGWYASTDDIGGRGAWMGELGDVLLTGYYPTVSWIWLVYAGLLVGRLDLRSDRVAALLTGGGAALAVAAPTLAAWLRRTVELGGDATPAAPTCRSCASSWADLFVATGHSDTTLDQLMTLGSALAVLGVCLLLGRYLRRLVWPGVALGRFALTVYVGHIVVYAADRQLFYSTTPAEGLRTTLAISAVSAAVATVWLAVLPRGPLEALDRGGWRNLVRPAVRALADDRGAPSLPDQR